MEQSKSWVKMIAEKLIVAGINYITKGGYKTVFKDKSLAKVKELVMTYYDTVDSVRRQVDLKMMTLTPMDLTPRNDIENDPTIYEEQDLYMDLCQGISKVILQGDKNDKRNLKIKPDDQLIDMKLRSMDFENGAGVVDFEKDKEHYSVAITFPKGGKENPVLDTLVEIILQLKANQHSISEQKAEKVVQDFCGMITKCKRVKDVRLQVTNQKGEKVDQTTHILKSMTRNNAKNKNVYLMQTVLNPDQDDAEILQYQISSELPFSRNEKKYCSMISFAVSQYLQGKENHILNDQTVEKYKNIDLEKLYEANRKYAHHQENQSIEDMQM